MTQAPTAFSAAAARSMLAAAVLAPSSHNTQPWLFTLREDGVDLIADRRRALPVNDPHDRELTISCGCALFNLRVAAAAAGLQASAVMLPEAGHDDLLARVIVAPTDTPQPDAALHAFIAARRTYRQRFSSDPVEPLALARLAMAAAAEGARLHLLENLSQRLGAADLVAQGDAIQWSNPSWRRELAAWMHPRRQRDGLIVPALAAPVAQAVVRTFDMGQGVGAKDRQLADESPVLAVLATEGDTVLDWLAAGQALQHMLLLGVQLGLQASFLNQPVQVDALRGPLQELAGCSGAAQLLLRLGKPALDMPAPPRRPLADMVEP